MTDLIQRLREWHCHDCMVQDLTNEAADELERLTRERDECLKHCNDDEGYEAMKAERDRLRAALERIASGWHNLEADSIAREALK
jgi:hypothetical protein